MFNRRAWNKPLTLMGKYEERSIIRAVMWDMLLLVVKSRVCRDDTTWGGNEPVCLIGKHRLNH